jgi:hypothetical protein
MFTDNEHARRREGLPEIHINPESVVLMERTSEGDWGVRLEGGHEIFVEDGCNVQRLLDYLDGLDGYYE